MLDQRVAIEAGSVLLAAERARAPRLDRLDELIEAMSSQTEDFEEYRRTELRFHIGLAETAASAPPT